MTDRLVKSIMDSGALANGTDGKTRKDDWRVIRAREAILKTLKEPISLEGVLFKKH